jgi:hypothetical protein
MLMHGTCRFIDGALELCIAAVKEPGMCAKRLATEALTRGSGDNIAVVVAFLQPVRTCFGTCFSCVVMCMFLSCVCVCHAHICHAHDLSGAYSVYTYLCMPLRCHACAIMLDCMHACMHVGGRAEEPAAAGQVLAIAQLLFAVGVNGGVACAHAQVSTLERIYADGRQKYGAHQMFLPAKRVMKKANFAATSSADEWRDTY